METRELKQSEPDDLLALYAHMHESDDPLPEREKVKAVWQEMQDNPAFKCFGVYIEGDLVSSCVLGTIPNLSRGCRPYGVIENVVTNTDYRRKGYATAVLKHALDYAWNRDCYKVMLLTGRKSEGIYQLYESVGFDRNAKQVFLARPPETE